MAAIALSERNSINLQKAFTLFQNGRIEPATSITQDILKIQPEHPDALHLLGLIFFERKDYQKARNCLSKALSAAPHHADLHNDMGFALMASEQYAEALASFETALSIDPSKATIRYNKGIANKNLGNFDAAVDALASALALNPRYAAAHFSLGNLLLDRKEFQGAERHFCAAIEIRPDYIAAYNHLAISLEEQNRVAEACQWLIRAHRIDPLCADTLCNIGNLARKSCRFTEAISLYRLAIRQRPDFVEAHLNLAVILLLLKDLKTGWPEYEWRLRQFPADSGYPNRHGLPLWQGQSLKGKCILVYDEQGFGDVFMFSRYLFKLKAMGARVVFETRSALFNLFKNLPLIDETVLRHGDIKPQNNCDCCIPLMSLPARFKTNSDTIPEDTPYLFADAKKTDCWSKRITGSELKIGLVWKGSDADRSRRCYLRHMEPLFGLAGIHWYGLQKDFGSESASSICSSRFVNLGSELKDFTDTAAVIANLDLVITIDTAVAHLAGAMGKPVWVMLPSVPDWRWFLGSKTTPWYRNMRLYRQKALGEWGPPISEIGRDLAKWLANRDSQPPDEIVNKRYLAALSDQRRGAYDKAETGYRDLMSLAPDHYPTLAALGLLYIKTGRNDDAVQALRRAIELKPNDHLCLNNLGIAFQRMGQTERAMTAFASAIACNPDDTNACHNLGNLFGDLQDLDGVIQWYAKALEKTPDDSRAQLEMGKLYLKRLDTANARAHFEKSVALEPGFAPARISLATTALMQGDFTTGWKQYRWRFKDDGMRGHTYPGHFNLPRWLGEPFKKRRLIVHCEQGLGDSIQFSRFLPQVKEFGGQVIFQAQDALLPLFRDFPGIDILQRLPAHQPETPEADFYCPLMDVPHCLGISLETIPARTPYLTADPEKVAQWRRRFDSNRFKIGIVWAGNPNHLNDRNRSLSVGHLLELSHLDGIQLYSLQKEMSRADHQLLSDQNSIISTGCDFMDFSDTAAAIHCLDMVISVDTAVAHLAGAMAKPVWVMLPFVPDWRWMLLRPDTPWYPTMRLFRQPHANTWEPVVEAIKENLKIHLHGV